MRRNVFQRSRSGAGRYFLTADGFGIAPDPPWGGFAAGLGVPFGSYPLPPSGRYPFFRGVDNAFLSSVPVIAGRPPRRTLSCCSLGGELADLVYARFVLETCRFRQFATLGKRKCPDHSGMTKHGSHDHSKPLSYFHLSGERLSNNKTLV